jgi:hypothetical protein
MAPKKNETQADDDDDAVMAGLINDAVTAHFKRKMPTMITAALKEVLPTALSEAMQGQQAAGQGQAQGQAQGQQAAGQGQAQGQAQGQQADPKIAALEAQIATLTKQNKERDEQVKRSQQEALESRRDSSLGEALAKLGVDQHRRRGAAAILRESMVYDEASKSWKYRAQREGYHDDIGIEDGLKEWASTDEGKSYITSPIRGGGAGTQPVRASGGGGAGGGAGPRTTVTVQQAKQAKKAELDQQLVGLTQSLLGGGGGDIKIA